jgi:hypothetical protein
MRLGGALKLVVDMALKDGANPLKYLRSCSLPRPLARHSCYKLYRQEKSRPKPISSSKAGTKLIDEKLGVRRAGSALQKRCRIVIAAAAIARSAANK